jgi:hypothetical protein
LLYSSFFLLLGQVGFQFLFGQDHHDGYQHITMMAISMEATTSNIISFYIPFIDKMQALIPLRQKIHKAGYYLDFASVEFSEDTRQQVRSCSTLPPRTTKRDLRQALDNAVDLVKSALPKGKQS